VARKKARGKQPKSEIVTVRLDPKLRFIAELAARMQRRTLSSFIEWAIETALEGYRPEEKMPTARETGDLIWDVDDADRFVKLAVHGSSLLTHSEQVLWKAIQELALSLGIKPVNWLVLPSDHPLLSRFRALLRKNWTSFERGMDEEMSVDQILDAVEPVVAELRLQKHPKLSPKPPTTDASEKRKARTRSSAESIA